jgi:hypothetical protein
MAAYIDGTPKVTGDAGPFVERERPAVEAGRQHAGGGMVRESARGRVQPVSVEERHGQQIDVVRSRPTAARSGPSWSWFAARARCCEHGAFRPSGVPDV